MAIDAIALLESSLAKLCDATIAVIAPQEVRCSASWPGRAFRRTTPGPGCEAQKSDDYFTEGCDHTLYNDCAQAEEFALRAKTLVESIL